ncbi:ABC-type nitrate sulfonate bicarbonate transport systems periplasmic components-like protein [Pleurostoma richardsiae]|uniref:ABC-type nitrate sulfonate bicarbonate transport systems periplasmic components-like protein n=1 Tax=Pleurostoma richardsiae TaxID=41990 RepID=A0AA38RKE0_9PEZI|nr:ABC-type nitrate sulfonate bicarbonate transport systems periplasmic components-like protein [Pleurostoma richardsiae]
MFSPVCYLSESDIMATAAPLRVGYVPEHFSTPIYFAKKHFGLDADLIPFPSGTGHMITALRVGEIDIGIGLTEGWVAGLGKEDVEGDGGYRIVGTYVETPLCWAISTGSARPEIASIDSLKGGKIGVSRIGSGSYVMGFVLADQQGWLTSPEAAPYSDTVVLNTFANLRAAVNSGTADFFMWEHFTSKRYYDSGEIRKVGEIYTPWSSWKIVAATGLTGEDGKLDPRLADLFGKLDRGIRHFNENAEEAVRYISTELDYSEDDAREWMKTVRFPSKTEGADPGVIGRTVDVLRKAGVLVAGRGMKPEQMVAKQR